MRILVVEDDVRMAALLKRGLEQEVEVTLRNGKQVDVHLDERFEVINQVGEESPDDTDSK